MLKFIFWLTQTIGNQSALVTVGNRFIDQGAKASVAFALSWLAKQTLEPMIERYTYYSEMTDLQYLYLAYLEAHQRCLRGENVTQEMNKITFELLSEIRKYIMFVQKTDDITPFVKSLANNYIADPLKDSIQDAVANKITSK